MEVYKEASKPEVGGCLSQQYPHSLLRKQQPYPMTYVYPNDNAKTTHLSNIIDGVSIHNMRPT
jgi:hypothetical protein